MFSSAINLHVNILDSRLAVTVKYEHWKSIGSLKSSRNILSGNTALKIYFDLPRLYHNSPDGVFVYIFIYICVKDKIVVIINSFYDFKNFNNHFICLIFQHIWKFVLFIYIKCPFNDEPFKTNGKQEVKHA